ncbi:MAG TPA: UDP-N-acetylmuramoyl-L-alanine--D-glutamate ligase [Peptococcaceae bacterium]|nr:MAG: UDP-N-acetylmuramoylalanine--D-glutamate ligase [Clostridia bacterium 41_269]HBT20113.1 UDP-N-acetylmuramoyl-L-alanine--D-glutamate ligase [Peptococcaceae bacterium]
MIIKNKKVLVVGAGKTGTACAHFLNQMGARVTLADIKKDIEMKEVLEKFKDTPVVVKTGGYPDVDGSTDLVIVSPGVPLDVLPIKQAHEKGIPVWSELELAFRMFNAPVIAVTGTNGKTTTTALIGAMFEDAGKPVVIAGNIGIPLIEKVSEITSHHVVVVEVSSFQLECIETFKPKMGIVLNLTPDHLDRHGTLENYARAKERIFLNQSQGDFSILNYDDPRVKKMSQSTKGEVIFFSIKHTLEQGAYLFENKIYLALGDRAVPVIDRKDIFIKGEHNVQNALAAVLAGAVMGLEIESMSSTLKTFKGVPHRLEFVDEIDGVKYINDSKGTNPDASIKALLAFDEPIVLIAGGRNKGSDFSQFAEIVKEKARAVVLLGEAADEIYSALKEKGFYEIYKENTLEEAVYRAGKIARPGEVVLLSPACASWDMFKSYEERGDLFKSLVASLRR